MSTDLELLDGSNVEVGGRASSPEITEPVAIKAQAWKGYYVDPTTQDIHVFLHDAYYGVGGFKGDIPVNEHDPDATNNTGTYSYVQYTTTELQYRLRAKNANYYNYYGRYIDSMINPVFSQNRLLTTTKNGGEVVEDKQMMQFNNNASGNGVSYTALQKFAMQELRVHDVAYYSMTRIEDSDIPSLSVYRAIDFIGAEKDDYGRLESILMYNGEELEVDGNKVTKYAKAIQFYMSGGTCRIQMYKGEYDGCVGRWDQKDIEWNKDGEERDTGIDDWCIYAHLPVATANGELLPDMPSSQRIANVCLGIFQKESKFNWLYSIATSPTPYIYGNSRGFLSGMGQSLMLKTNDITKGYAPAPDFMMVDSGLVDSCSDVIEFDIERLRDIAKENGVDSRTGAQSQSGESKQFDFLATEQKLRGTADMCEDMDKWVWYMFNKYTNRNTTADVFEYERNYPQTFYPEQEAELQEYEAFISAARDAGAVNTALIVMEKYARKLLGRSATDAEVTAISEEIGGLTLRSEDRD